MTTLIYHQDPGHGWLGVPPDVLNEVGMTQKDFSHYSYVGRDGTVYLEEDCDMPKFLRHVQETKGVVVPITELHTNSDHWIRNLRNYCG